MSTPYLLIPIIILSLSLYLIGQMLVKLNIITETFHRKFWNSILLIVFLATAILGLLLAIQINYKLEWSFVKATLKWHVDFGIGLSFVAALHALWHLKYYLKIFKPSDQQDTSQTSANTKISGTERITSLMLLSGFTSTIIQVLLIREIATVFEGNELMMGWTLGAWMLLTGIGAFIGKQKRIAKNARKLLPTTLAWLSIIPTAIVVLLNLLKYQLFPVGVMVNPSHFLVLLFIVLSPICILSGLIYSLLIELFRSNRNGFIKVYSFESIGSLAGGLIVSFVFIQWLSILQSLLILGLIINTFLIHSFRKKGYLITGMAFAILLIVSFILPIDRGIKSFLFTNQKVLESKETFYGNLTITESAGQYNFFGNGSLLFTTDNTILNEENVHYAMLQRQKPENVLIISGGISGMIDEILKYPSVKAVDYVEINPKLVSIGNQYKPLSADKRLSYHPVDGRRYIQQANRKYDIVIFAIPSPSSLQVNRFYTDEFLSSLKKIISKDAVIVYGLPPAGNYISPVKASIEASVYQTLKNRFRNVEIIPGEKDYILASDSTISIRISQIGAVKGVENRYVNPYYLDDYSIQQRGDQIKSSIKDIMLINTDDRPIPVFYETMQFVSQFKGNKWMLFTIPIVLLIIPLFFMRSITKGMYIAGFSASSIEILLIFSFQIIYGYVYSAIGIVIAVFMGGLAAGSVLGYRIDISKKHFLASQVALSAYALIFPLLWYFHADIENSAPILLIFFLMTFIPSAIVGFQYVVGSSIHPEGTTKAATTMYAADLIGSALGVAVVTVILLPLLGLINCCFVIAGLNAAGALLTLIFTKKDL